MKAHTPKPWKAFGGIIQDAKGRVVARAGCLADLDETDANAMLLEAAPELLEACEWAYKLLCPLEFPGRATKEAQLGLCNLRDAIAKAKGQA